VIRASLTRPPDRGRLVVALAVGGCTLALAACGSTRKEATTGGSSRSVSFLRFSECMRSHGVSNFPDPSPGGGIHVSPGSGFNPQSPVVQSAQQSCKKLLPGGGPPAHVPESVKLRALRFAQCMRSHGVPNYPDPTFPAGGGVIDRGAPAGINPNSPAFQNAAKACGGGG
jgi:hypothetical protein